MGIEFEFILMNFYEVKVIDWNTLFHIFHLIKSILQQTNDSFYAQIKSRKSKNKRDLIFLLDV